MCVTTALSCATTLLEHASVLEAPTLAWSCTRSLSLAASAVTSGGLVSLLRTFARGWPDLAAEDDIEIRRQVSG